jgi:hypothetical protein
VQVTPDRKAHAIKHTCMHQIPRSKSKKSFRFYELSSPSERFGPNHRRPRGKPDRYLRIAGVGVQTMGTKYARSS